MPAAGADESAVIEACIKSADADNGRPRDCIGRLADACLDKPENQSTHAMVSCSNGKEDIWDRLLNAEYQRLLAAVEGNAKDDIVKCSDSGSACATWTAPSPTPYSKAAPWLSRSPRTA
jgi:hypothetical protein